MGRRLLSVFVSGLMIAGSGLAAFAQGASESRVALVIGNGKYPDADAPIATAIGDARSIADELKRNGFDVDLGENLTKEGMQRAIDGFYGKIRPGSAALLFFSGYGIQTGRQSYMIPTNAQIWTEAEVRRDGFSLDAILAEMNSKGAAVKLAIIDAGRRNPFERRFRGVSAGLATVNLPKGGLVMYSAAPSAVVPDADAANSLFVNELLKELRAPGLTVEEAFNRTRTGVARASRSEQVPWISSSLVEDFSLTQRTATAAPPPRDPPPRPQPAPEPAAKAARETTSPPVAEPAKPAAADAEAREDFEFAERIGTKKAWTDFLAQHKSGPYADRARTQLDRIDNPPPAGKGAQVAVATPNPPGAPAPVRPAPAPPPKASPGAALSEDDRRIADLDVRLRANPSDADGYYQRGQLQAKKRDYRSALRDFDKAVQLNPNDAEALNNRCWTRAVLGELQLALGDCNESLRIRPDSADALDSRGFTLLKSGQPARAIADFNAVLRVQPRQASALFGRGKAKLQNGDDSGRADLASAKTIAPSIAEEFARYGVP